MFTFEITNCDLKAPGSFLLESEHKTSRSRFLNQNLRNLWIILSVGLSGAPPWQAPQSVRRKDDGEEPGHSNRDQHPDEKEMSARIRNPAGDADTLSPHVG